MPYLVRKRRNRIVRTVPTKIISINIEMASRPCGFKIENTVLTLLILRFDLLPKSLIFNEYNIAEVTIPESILLTLQ